MNIYDTEIDNIERERIDGKQDIELYYAQTQQNDTHHHNERQVPQSQ